MSVRETARAETAAPFGGTVLDLERRVWIAAAGDGPDGGNRAGTQQSEKQTAVEAASHLERYSMGLPGRSSRPRQQNQTGELWDEMVPRDGVEPPGGRTAQALGQSPAPVASV